MIIGEVLATRQAEVVLAQDDHAFQALPALSVKNALKNAEVIRRMPISVAPSFLAGQASYAEGSLPAMAVGAV